MPKDPRKNKPFSPSASALRPYWATSDRTTVKLYHDDVMDVLRKLPAQSVHCCVTSPPYWGLRDYGTGTWVGGDGSCDHSQIRSNSQSKVGKGTNLAFRPERYQCQGEMSSNTCGKCGAKRVDRQIGSEAIVDCEIGGKRQRAREGLCPDWDSACFVCRMVYVFREVRRVLHDSGTVFLNLGDSYSGGKTGRQTGGGNLKLQPKYGGNEPFKNRRPPEGLRSGNLVGVPWRVALALQADGWILRQDIIWGKKSPMPEPVRNRCTKAHEYVFLLAKKPGYYYDAEAIRERTGNEENEKAYAEMLEKTGESWFPRNSYDSKDARGSKHGFKYHSVTNPNGRNKRSVWMLSSEAYPGAHFATFPKKLIEPCILAGSSAYGCCTKCGAPWRRVVETTQLKRERPNSYVKRKPGEQSDSTNTCANTVAGVDSRTVRWEPTCECHGRFEKRKGKRLGYGSYHDHKGDGKEYGLRQQGKGPASVIGEPTKEFPTTVTEYVSDLSLEDHPVKPCTILDPFVGSATTCCVALAHGRRSIGIDLSEKYLRENAVPRIEGELLARPALAHLAGRKRKAVMVGEPISEGEGDST